MNSQTQRLPHRRFIRRGITLLEVLLSLAVAVVGIFGVLVLIPISARMAETGLKLDEAGALGRSALHEFEVRNMRNPSNWRRLDLVNPNVGGSPNFVPVTVRANKSYCIDPEFVARNLSQISPDTFNRVGAWFPINSSSMLDLGNAQQPLITTPLPSAHRISLSSGTGFPPDFMSEAFAREIFSSQDDLTIDSPEDTTNPAFQHFHGEELFNPSAPDPTKLTKRQSGGSKSWLGLLTPRPSPSGLPESDLYTLYVVVFDDRDSNLTSEVNLQFSPPTREAGFGGLEKWSTVTFPPSGGLGGGEVSLSAFDPVRQVPQTDRVIGPRELELKRDEWILLCQRISARRSPSYIAVYDLFRWYRISDVDEIDTSGTVASRYVTLDGPDWNTPFPGTSNGITIGPIFAVSMPGVLEVYERTVRLEQRSIWSE